MTKVVVVESVNERVLVSDVRRIRRSMTLWGVKKRNFLVVNTSDLELKRGDLVEILLPTGRTILQTMFIFLLPLILFPVAYGMATAFVPETGDEVLFLVGFGALLLGFPLGVFLCRIVGETFPTISRVLTDEDAFKLDDFSECGVCVNSDCQMLK